MFCVKCGFEIEDGMKFCPKCGDKVVEIHDTTQCTNCGKDLNGLNTKYCPFCGSLNKYALDNKNVKDIVNDRKPKTPLTTRKRKCIRWICVSVVFLILLGGFFYFLINERNSIKPEYYINDEGYIVFGQYEQDGIADNGLESIEWIILEENEDHYLLISRYCLDSISYETNDDKSYLSWDESYLRKWLNTIFYDTAFSENEKKCIIPRPLYEITGESEEVIGEELDNCFILSQNECLSFWGSHYYLNWSQLAVCEPTEYAKKRGIITETWSVDNSDKNLRQYGYSSVGIVTTSPWWLRDNFDSDFAMCVDQYGHVGSTKTASSISVGVRPVIYIAK